MLFRSFPPPLQAICLSPPIYFFCLDLLDLLETIGSFCNLLFFCFGFFQYRYQTQITNGIIVNPQTKLFQEPNSASESFTVLNEGSEFKPLQITDQWLLILTEDNQEGWILRRFAGLY